MIDDCRTLARGQAAAIGRGSGVKAPGSGMAGGLTNPHKQPAPLGCQAHDTHDEYVAPAHEELVDRLPPAPRGRRTQPAPADGLAVTSPPYRSEASATKPFDARRSHTSRQSGLTPHQEWSTRTPLPEPHRGTAR